MHDEVLEEDLLDDAHAVQHLVPEEGLLPRPRLQAGVGVVLGMHQITWY